MQDSVKLLDRILKLKRKNYLFGILIGGFIARYGYNHIVEIGKTSQSISESILGKAFNHSQYLKSHQQLFINIFKLLLLALCYKVGSKNIRRYLRDKKNKELISEGQKFRNESYEKLKSFELPEFEKALTEKILDSDVYGLLEMLKKREIKSVEILQIYMKRVQVYGTAFQLVTQDSYESALKLANKCDYQIEQLFDQKEQLEKLFVDKPLFGIPISIKDNFQVEGLACTMGLINNINQIPAQNGKIIQVLIESGAIPFVKSNVPQILLTIESTNYIFGRAKNPWNIDRTAGGSSGGEAGLVASGCSPLGIGSDIGSSIRQPAAFCGIYGLKPGTTRVTLQGLQPPTKKELQVLSHCIRMSNGPLGKSTRDCAIMMQALLKESSWNALDTAKYPKDIFAQDNIEFDMSEFKKEHKKLKIGYFKSLGALAPSSPANQRGVLEAVNALKKLGHEVEEVNIPNIGQIVCNFVLAIGPDGLHQLDLFKQLEPIIQEYTFKIAMTKQRKYSGEDQIEQKGRYCSYKELLQSLKMNKEDQSKLIWQTKMQMTAGQYKMLSYNIQKSKVQFHNWFEEQKLDCIICPVVGLPALKHKSSPNLLNTVLYSAIFNILDVPAGSIPITQVRENEQEFRREDIASVNETYKTHLNNSLKGSKGLPIGVQVVCLHKQEEKVLNIMNLIENQVQFKAKPECDKNVQQALNQQGYDYE